MKHGIVNTSGITHITLKTDDDTALTIKLRFGLPAVQAYANMVLGEDSEKYIHSGGTALTAMGIARLLQFGYENNCLVEDKQPEILFGKFMLFVEEMILDNPEELNRVVKVFDDSRYTKKAADQMEEITKIVEEAKKKSIGNLLKATRSMNSGSHKKSSTPVRKGNSTLGRRGTNVTKPRKARKRK